jgi:hypothetical protein
MGVVKTLVSKTDVVMFGMRCSTSARYAGKLEVILALAVEPACFQRRPREDISLAPLGERVDCNRRLHQPGQDG